MTRLGPLVALVSTLAAVALFVLAADVFAVWRSVEADDLRFESASTRQVGLWEELGLLPSITLRALALDDDLAYRRATASFHAVRPSDRLISRPAFGDTRLESMRGQVQLELTRTSQAETDEGRRSRLLTFLGILPLDRVITDGDERAGVLRTAIGILQTAVQSDPVNAEAKLNLELLLRDALATNLPPNAPGGHPAGGPRSGPGGVGSTGGY